MKVALRWLVASFVYVVLLAAPSVVLPIAPARGITLPETAPAPWEMAAYLATMLPAFAYLVHRPRVRGFRQVAMVGLFAWGTQTFMTQMETEYFRSAFPAISDTEMMRLFLRNLLTLAAFLPLAFWLFGRFRSEPGAKTQLPLPAAPRGLLFKLPVLGVAYVFVYFLFGYYVAYRSESVRLLYSGSAELPTFWGQLAVASAERPMIMPFQFIRGLLWAGLAALLLAFLRRGRVEAILASTALFAVLPTAQLVLDNPFMPAAVRYAHFVEVGSSMALFGALAAWLLTASRQARPSQKRRLDDAAAGIGHKRPA